LTKKFTPSDLSYQKDVILDFYIDDSKELQKIKLEFHAIIEKSVLNEMEKKKMESLGN